MAHGKWWVTTSFLFLACCAFAQVPTPIRSVSSLPVTCKGGSATQSSDMVVLITGGIGANYLCTQTDTWSVVAGGGGATPGGTAGTTQYNNGAGILGGTVAEVVATSFAGADICAQVNTAIAALPAAGGTVVIPGGNWPACAGSGGIAITINKPGIILRGMGSGQGQGIDVGATTINIAAGVTGIDVDATRDHIQDLFLFSNSSGAGTDDGIRIRGGLADIQRVTVKHFGRNGIRVDGSTLIAGGADLWLMEHVDSVNNFGDGMRWVSPCTDNHLGTGIQLNSSLNGGYGYYIDCGGANSFITLHATQNTGGGVFVNFSWNNFYNTYVESGTGSSFVIASGLAGVNVTFQAFGQPTTITNPGATASANHIEYFGPEGWPERADGFYTGEQPGTAGNTTYHYNVGGFNPHNLGIFDVTHAAWLFHYNPAIPKWTFDTPVTLTPNASFSGLNIGNIAGDPSTLANGDIWYDTVSNKFRCYENGGSTNCIGGSGSVTHTAGALTAGKIVIGNGAADVQVDPNASTDGAGNVVGVSFQTSGVNGGFTGIEGTGAGLTAGAGIDLLYPDSTRHCWHQNLNNVDKGCTITANTSGLGSGSIFGAASLLNLNQTNNTIWGLTLQNAVATAASAGGLSVFVDDNGDAFLGATTIGGTVVANVGLRQSGEAFLNGNGSVGDPASVSMTIPSSATADFVLNNGSTVATGSPRLKWTGKSGGSAVISVAASAGTPNPILLPTTTGSSGQELQTDGANPQQTSWVTPVKSYNHSGTLQTAAHIVQDSCTLGTDCAVTLTSTAVYTNSTSYTCVCQDDTAIASCKVAQSSGSAFTITGTGTDSIRYQCVGN
jgi:hypothetical protein